MEMLDGANIEYAPGRVMRCYARVTPEDPTPLNFIEHTTDYKTAHALARKFSEGVTEEVLRWRNQEASQKTLEMPSLFYKDGSGAIGVSDIFNFVAQLGMEPMGRLLFVESLEGPPVQGRTNYPSMTAFVDKKNVWAEQEGLPKTAGFSIDVLHAFRTHGVAVHELTHLAGGQDVIFFSYRRVNGELKVDIRVPGSALEDWYDSDKGSYFEEGLASLVHAMYYWRSMFDIDRRTVDNHSERHHIFKSPGGKISYIPERIGNIVADSHEYMHTAWGIERLVCMAPDVWDILIASRRYGAISPIIRKALRASIERIAPGLFEHIDNTSIDDLDQTMETTSRIDHTAKKIDAQRKRPNFLALLGIAPFDLA